jgi:hypothetical protein
MFDGAWMEAMFNGYWLVLGIILLPVYGMLLGWFFGKPRSSRLALMGVGYLVGLMVLLWGGLFVFAEVLRLVFF